MVALLFLKLLEELFFMPLFQKIVLSWLQTKSTGKLGKEKGVAKSLAVRRTWLLLQSKD